VAIGYGGVPGIRGLPKFWPAQARREIQEFPSVAERTSCARPGGGLNGRMTVRKLLHTRMRVNDIERSVRFYREALGLAEVRRHTSPRGAQLVFLKAPESEEEIELCRLPGAPAVEVQPDLMHLAFEVDDLEAFAQALAAKGFALSDGPVRTGSGSTIAFLDAPEGYEVELIQPAGR
jgi:lactoylglutathione lyase